MTQRLFNSCQKRDSIQVFFKLHDVREILQVKTWKIIFQKYFRFSLISRIFLGGQSIGSRYALEIVQANNTVTISRLNST